MIKDMTYEDCWHGAFKLTDDYYMCPYCHSEYSNPVTMAKCILECNKKTKIAEDNDREYLLVLGKLKNTKVELIELAWVVAIEQIKYAMKLEDEPYKDCLTDDFNCDRLFTANDKCAPHEDEANKATTIKIIYNKNNTAVNT